MNPPRRLAALAFLFGLLVGSWAQRVLCRRPYGKVFDAQRALSHLDRELRLDPGQKDAVEKVLLSRQAEIASEEAERRKRMTAGRLATRREIAALLTPRQQPKFRELCERADKRIKERWGDDK